MKNTAYLVIKYDLFPYYVFEEMIDDGKGYYSKSGRGYGERNYSDRAILKRLNKEDFFKLKEDVAKLKKEKADMEKKLKAKAEDLLSSFD